jgi:hypothetical protein
MLRPHRPSQHHETTRGVWGLTVFIRRNPDTRKQEFAYETVHGTLADAQARRDELELEISKGKHDHGVRTFETLLDEWLTRVKKRARAESTLAGYRAHIELDIRPALGKLRVDKITAHDLDRYFDSMTNRPGTCQHC